MRWSFKSPVSIAVAVVVFFIVAGLLFPPISGPSPRGKAKKAYAKVDVSGFLAALNSYKNEYGALPGGDAAAVMTALRGENLRKIVFFEGQPELFNAKGEFIDSWGTPYRLDISNPNKPRVWSRGPNRRDENGTEGSDDIVSWR